MWLPLFPCWPLESPGRTVAFEPRCAKAGEAASVKIVGVTYAAFLSTSRRLCVVADGS